MASVKLAYANAAQITITLNSLANNSARQSAVLDNTSNLYEDYLIGGSFKVTNSALGTNPVVNVWAAALTDGTNYGGTNGSNTLGGGDAAFTMPSNTGNLVLLASVPIQAQNATEYFQPRSLAAAFGGTLPPKVVIICQNQSGQALDASAGGTIYNTGVYRTVA